MSELLESLNTRYLNRIFLTDDYNVDGIIFTNYKVSVIKKWIVLFKRSKYCTTTYNPPKIEKIDYKGMDDEVKKLLEDVNISEDVKKRLCFFPKHLSIPKESKFDLIKFKDYLIERKLDCIYISREDYEKELPPKREKLIKRKKRKWY
jgi:hypothetical protein